MLDATERFERLAAAFYEDTGMMAPGKDCSPEMNMSDNYNERFALWGEWLASDSAQKVRDSFGVPQA